MQPSIIDFYKATEEEKKNGGGREKHDASVRFGWHRTKKKEEKGPVALYQETLLPMSY